MQNSALLFVAERTQTWSCLLVGVEEYDFKAVRGDELLQMFDHLFIRQREARRDVDNKPARFNLWKQVLDILQAVFKSSVRILEAEVQNLVNGCDIEAPEQLPWM